jgi:hypothetical protein
MATLTRMTVPAPMIKMHTTKDELFTCPKCSSYLSMDAIICIECGLNLRTNFSVSTAKNPSGLNKLLYMVLAAGGLFILVNILMLNKAPKNMTHQPLSKSINLFSPVEAPVQPEPYVPPKRPRKVEQPKLDPEPRPQPSPEPTKVLKPKPRPEATVDPVPTPEPVAEPRPVPVPETNLAEQKEALFLRIKSDMDKTHPQLKSGRFHTVYAKKGPMTGLVNLISRNYLLMTVNGKREQVYFDQLETRTRICVDAAFRNKRVEEMTYRKLVEIRMKEE